MLYGLVSGGIHDQGPRTFLYEVDPFDLSRWTYVSPLVTDMALGYRDSKWSGDFGVNWECTNFFHVKGESAGEQLVMITGAEGGAEQPWVSEYHNDHAQAARRIPRYANWFFGTLGKLAGDQVRVMPEPAGLLDWGIYYAANSFLSPDGRRFLWGWLIEEDLKDDVLANKGWTGCMGVPREVFLQTTHGVHSALCSRPESIGCMETRSTGVDSSVSTLGIRPIAEVSRLREALVYDHLPSSLKSHRTLLPSAPLSCEISASIHVFDSTQSVTLFVRHSDDLSVNTAITFQCREEELVVTRERSTGRKDVNTSAEIGSHTLFPLESLCEMSNTPWFSLALVEAMHS